MGKRLEAKGLNNYSHYFWIGGLMKAYNKKLKPELIKGLNDLYEQKGSWWQTLQGYFDK